MKTGGALSCDCVGGCWGRPLSGGVPRGMLSWVGRYRCLVGWEPLVCHHNMVAISPGNAKECQGGSSLLGLLLLRCWQEAGAAKVGNILAHSPSCSGGNLAWSGSQSSTWQCQPRQALTHCLRGRQIACGQRRGDERERGN